MKSSTSQREGHSCGIHKAVSRLSTVAVVDGRCKSDSTQEADRMDTGLSASSALEPSSSKMSCKSTGGVEDGWWEILLVCIRSEEWLWLDEDAEEAMAPFVECGMWTFGVCGEFAPEGFISNTRLWENRWTGIKLVIVQLKTTPSAHDTKRSPHRNQPVPTAEILLPKQ